MGKYFGTDGIRGVANKELTPQIAYRAGLAAAAVIGAGSANRRAVIGKDTRISCDMIEAALCAGLCAGGVDAVQLGVVPTPAVAFVASRTGAAFGVVISASHNPFEHNGIKFFKGDGFKLSDGEEGAIEALIDDPSTAPIKIGAELGRIITGTDGFNSYVAHVASLATSDYKGLKVAFDCANGASSVTVRKLFGRFACKSEFIHDAPDGININENCGSTHTESLRRLVLDGGFDVGFAFDGDADRCLIIDEKGDTIDGDVLMALAAQAMKADGTLRGDMLVGTIVSNSGLDEFGRSEGIRILHSDVGDRRVIELMRKEGANLGGEVSGHTIFLDHSTTGDGQLSAIKFLNILMATGESASKLAQRIPKFPQAVVNAPTENADKKRRMESAELAAAITLAETELAGAGRVLIRPSGTEALIRVTVEASTDEKAQKLAEELAAAIGRI